MKDFDQQHYKETFASLPSTANFALNNPEDQHGILNDHKTKHLEEHAPMKKNTRYKAACTVDKRFKYSFFKKRLAELQKE